MQVIHLEVLEVILVKREVIKMNYECFSVGSKDYLAANNYSSISDYSDLGSKDSKYPRISSMGNSEYEDLCADRNVLKGL